MDLMRFKFSQLITMAVLVVAVCSVFVSPVRNAFAQSLSSVDSITQARLEGEKNCSSPPANFDPMTASAEDIARYGVPRKPVDSGAAAIRDWVNVLHHAKQRSCAAAIPGKGQTYSAISSSDNYVGFLGYPSSGNSLRAARGYFQPACVITQQTNQRIVSWVGLGGNGSNLWQGGIESDFNTPSGYAQFWYEAKPLNNSIQYIPSSALSYTCGDQAYTYVDYNFQVANQAYIYLADTTKSKYWTKSMSFVPGQGVADFVDERPSCSSGPSELADYNDDPFTGTDVWYRNGTFLKLSQIPYDRVTMYDYQGGPVLANPGYLNGDAFTTTWVATGTTTCPI